MLTERPSPRPSQQISDAADQIRRARISGFAMAAVLGAFVAVVGALAVVTAPRPFSLAFVLLAVVVCVSVARPDVGVVLIVGLTLIGDGRTSWWYPFAKNFSSRESVLFVSDGLSINPLEIVMMVTLASWLFRAIGDPTWRFHRGRLLSPVIVFTGFAMLGMAYGLYQGGDLYVALWEARPIFYLSLLYVLMTNLIRTDAQRIALFVSALVGVALHSVLAINHYFGLPVDVRADLDRLTDHPAAIHMNAVMLLLVVVLLLSSVPTRLRVFAFLAAVPVSWAWVLSQRRASAIALAVGMLLVGVVMLWRSKRTAVWFLSIFTTVATVYVVAFWNVTGGLGFAAQAVKSVLAPESLSARDMSSNEYRRIETVNLWFTIRQRRLTGVGFGQQFYRPLMMPDISVFPFWQYMPHNSIIWIYLKMGFFGFASMLFLFSRAIQRGFVSVIRTTSPMSAAIIFASLGYVVMYLVFAYVDIAWDIRSVVFLTMAFYFCADVTTIEELPESVPTREAVRATAGHA